MAKNARNKGRRRKRKGPTPSRTSRLVDPRLVTAHVTHRDGVPVAEGANVIVALTPLRLTSGEILLHQAPLSPAFYLVTAKELRDRGERERAMVMRRLGSEASEHGDLQVPHRHSATLLDSLGRLASAVVLSAAAIEAYANEVIDRLEPTTNVTVERRGEDVVIPQIDMVRRLSTSEKLHLVIPLHTGRQTIKGLAVWERFRRLSELRDEVVHLKERGRTGDPDEPGIFGRLLLGEAASCIEDAAAIIDACEPTWLPAATRAELELPAPPNS